LLAVDLRLDNSNPPLLHMPTLGFLKKKRTRESPGQKDLASPTSTSSQPTSPITPTTSRDFRNSIASVSTQSTAPQVSQPAAPIKQESPEVVGEQQPMMTQGVTHQQQQAYGSAPVEQQNLPTINNLINPPQHDGAGQSMASQTKPEPANGSAKQTDSSQLKHVQPTVIRQTKGKYSLGDFEILRTLGTGSFGRVHLVQSKHNSRFYAVKVLKKQQVVKMKQVEHTNDERRMLQEVKHPFLITLWGTFQDSKNLYMVMDFVEGGELFSLLRKSQVGLMVLSI
jgi:protein kinase A